jgi:hypothetical protein
MAAIMHRRLGADRAIHVTVTFPERNGTIPGMLRHTSVTSRGARTLSSMADFARFLPLSQRSRVDESGVTSDRRREVADVVLAAARLLADGGSEAGGRTARFAADAGLAGELDEVGGALPALAAAVRGGRRRPIRALADAVRAVLVLSDDVGADPGLSPEVYGAVVLYATGAVHGARRAVVAGRTLRATDADWAFGTGPVLEGTARGIAAFLLGVSETPPHPPA